MKNIIREIALLMTITLFSSTLSCNVASRTVQSATSVPIMDRATDVMANTLPPSVTATFTRTPAPTATSSPLFLRAIFIDDHTIGIMDIRYNGHWKTIDISPNFHRNDSGSLAWSPDGKKLVFAANTPSDRDNPSRILYIYSLETGKVEPIKPTLDPYRNGIIDGQVDWSPDNNWIAFSGGREYIYLIHPDGSGYHSIFNKRKQESDTGGGVQVASWTSDSKYLLFYVIRSTLRSECYADVWIVDKDGKHPQKLVKSFSVGYDFFIKGCSAFNVAVSPDGKTIYYQSDLGKYYMSPIDCYYNNTDCKALPSKVPERFPITWSKDFYPRWTGKYRTFYE